MRTGRRLKSRRGFSLVEILIAVVILSIVSIAAVGLFFAFTKHFEQSADLTAARQRGEMVLSRLETAVLQAGLSMPNDSTNFKKVYSGGTTGLIQALSNAINGWDKPIYLPDDSNNKVTFEGKDYYKKIGIVYGLSSGIGVLEEYDVSENTEQKLELSEACPLDRIKQTSTGNTTDGWVTFSGCQTPFVVTKIDNTTNPPMLTVKSSRSDLIPFFAELQYVRALYAYVSSPGGTSPQFYIQDVTRGPAQPAVEGVSQVLFSFDDSGTDATDVLTVHVLLRGNRRFPGQYTLGDVPGWPIAGTVTDEDRHYRLVAISASWRVRN